MQEILNSIQPVIQFSQNVQINREVINTFADSLTEADLQSSDLPSEPYKVLENQEEAVAFIIIYASIVAGTWGEPKWGLEVNGKKMGFSLIHLS